MTGYARKDNLSFEGRNLIRPGCKRVFPPMELIIAFLVISGFDLVGQEEVRSQRMADDCLRQRPNPSDFDTCHAALVTRGIDDPMGLPPSFIVTPKVMNQI
jgi:hypothetical protein